MSMPSADPKFVPRNALPPALQELLAREAVFLMSRKRIGDALIAAVQQKSAGSFAKPLLSLFSRKDTREKRRVDVDNVEVLEAGLKKLDEAFPKLESCVERSIENYLREHDPEYVNGLASSRFIDDWHRLLNGFEHDISQLINTFGDLNSVLATLASSAACGSSNEGRAAIDGAVAAAQKAQEDVVFVNKIADSQRIRAGIDSITLYRQPEHNWRGSVHSLHFVLPCLAIDSVEGLIRDVNEVAERVRAALQGECQLASYAVGYGVTSYHKRVWASLREAAPLRVNPDELEAILAETEELMDSGRLQDWRPHRPELAAPAIVPGVIAPPPPNVPKASPPGLPPRDAEAPSGLPPALARITRPPELKLPSRGSGGLASRPAPAMSASASASSPPAATTHADPSLTASTEPLDSMVDLMAERNRLEQILLETRASLTEREQFLSESEARLMQVSQTQLEREVDLEQREEQLRDLEKRLRTMQSGMSSQPVKAAVAEPVAKKVFDEFNE